MQNEHFTTIVLSKHSSGHRDLVEKMQNGATVRTAQSWRVLYQTGASFTHVVWCLCGSPHGCVLIPVSQIWLVFDAQCWLLSVVCFVSSSEADGKASLSINPVMPVKLLCCTASTLQIWKSGADFSVAGYLGLVAHRMLSTNDLYCFHVCF